MTHVCLKLKYYGTFQMPNQSVNQHWLSLRQKLVVLHLWWCI